MPAVPAVRLEKGQAAGAPPGFAGMCPRFNFPWDTRDRIEAAASSMNALLEVARTIPNEEPLVKAAAQGRIVSWCALAQGTPHLDASPRDRLFSGKRRMSWSRSSMPPQSGAVLACRDPTVKTLATSSDWPEGLSPSWRACLHDSSAGRYGTGLFRTRSSSGPASAANPRPGRAAERHSPGTGLRRALPRVRRGGSRRRSGRSRRRGRC